MNPLIELKKTAPLLLITLTLHCFALLPRAEAVVPPPDGGYPGFTTAEGQNALLSLITGAGNTAVGWFSLFSNAEGSFNTATGAGALLFNTSHQNTAFGAASLLLNTFGAANTAVGAVALLNNTEGSENTATGNSALNSNTTGSSNTAMGVDALYSNTTGSSNTAIGAGALFNTFGVNNIGLGFNAGGAITSGTNIIAIGANVDGVSVGGQLDNSCYIGNIKDAQIDGTTASAVMVDQDGKLGTTSFSSQRFKKEIRPMGQTSEAVLALKPVTFRYKYDKKDAQQFGLIAEEVEKINPDLVYRDTDGKPVGVRYDQVNAMLLNEFLREHRKNEKQEAIIMQLKSTDAKQEAIIAQQQKQIEALIADLQKVSDQLELSKPAPQVVNNP